MQRSYLHTCLGAFAITVILIVAMCGFMLVDMSTDRYMPGRFGPLFLVQSVGPEGVQFSFLGEEYILSPQPLEEGLELLEPYQGLLPLHLRIAATAGTQLSAALDDWLE